MRTFGKTEKNILNFAIAAFLLFAYFLYDDSLLFSDNDSANLELIGQIQTTQNDVRRKNITQFGWMPADRQDRLYHNDSIFTGDRSEAWLAFKDGSQMKVSPNSLITLNFKNGQMQLDLRYGNLVGNLQKGSTLVIQSGDEQLTLVGNETSQIKFNKSLSGDLDVNLLSGSARLQRGNQNEKLDPSKALQLNRMGQLGKVEKIKLAALTQNDALFVLNEPGEQFNLNWQSEGPAANYQVEIANDPQFNDIVAQQQVPKKTAAIEDKLNEGRFYWRVNAKDRAGNVTRSKPQTFRLVYFKAPQVLAPTAGYQFNLEIPTRPQQTPQYSPSLTWTNSLGANRYQWQLSQDDKFSSVLSQGVVANTENILPQLSSGKYFARVRAINENNVASHWSKVHDFELNLLAKNMERPPAPILLTKKVVYKAPAKAERGLAAIEKPKAAWTAPEKIQNYKVQISKTPTFTRAWTYTSKDRNFAWQNFKPGKSYYRVFSIDENGTTSLPSEVGTFDISLSEPILRPISPVVATPNQPQKDVTLDWTEIPAANSYLVQLSKDQNFNSPLEYELTTPGGRITLDSPGTYNVRVLAKGEDAKPITGYSNIEKFDFTLRNPIAPPTLSEPFNKASIFLQQATSPMIWLEWKPVAGAQNYIVEVSSSEDFSKILFRKQVTTPRYLVKEQLPRTKLFWRVRAENKQNNEISDWAPAREFVIFSEQREGLIR